MSENDHIFGEKGINSSGADCEIVVPPAQEKKKRKLATSLRLDLSPEARKKLKMLEVALDLPDNQIIEDLINSRFEQTMRDWMVRVEE